MNYIKSWNSGNFNMKIKRKNKLMSYIVYFKIIQVKVGGRGILWNNWGNDMI